MENAYSPGQSVMLDTAAFVISIDTELAWSAMHNHSIPSELETVSRAEAEREMVRRLLGLFETYDTRVTWAVVGHLFLNHCTRTASLIHPEIVPPDYRWIDRDWFGPDPGTSLDSDPMWYGADIVQMISDAAPEHEIGSHSFSHLIVGDPDCSEEAFRSDLAACRETAARNGVDLRSFVYPRNTIGHLDVLADEGFSSYRGLRPKPFASKAPMIRRLATAGDKFIPMPGSIVHPERKGRLWNIPATNLFAPHDRPRYMPLRLWGAQQVRRLDHAAKHNSLYHLWFHPHNLLAQPDEALNTLEDVLEAASEQRSRGMIENLSMSDLSARLDSATRAKATEVEM